MMDLLKKPTHWPVMDDKGKCQHVYGETPYVVTMCGLARDEHDSPWPTPRTVARMDRCDRHQNYRSTGCPDCLVS